MAAVAPLVLTVVVSGCSAASSTKEAAAPSSESSSKEAAAPSGNVPPSGTSTAGTDDITYTTENFGGSKGVEGCGTKLPYMICGWVYMHKGIDDDGLARSAVWAKTGVLEPAILGKDGYNGQVAAGKAQITVPADPEVAPIASIGYIGSDKYDTDGYNQWHGVKKYPGDADLTGSGAHLDYHIDSSGDSHTESCVGSQFFSCGVDAQFTSHYDKSTLYLRAGVWTHPLRVKVTSWMGPATGRNVLVRQGDVNWVWPGSATVMNIVNGSDGPVESGPSPTGTPASQIFPELGSNSGSYGMLLAGDGAAARLQYKIEGGGWYDGALVNINIDYSNHGDGAGKSSCTVTPAQSQNKGPLCKVTGTGQWDHPQSLQVDIVAR